MKIVALFLMLHQFGYAISKDSLFNALYHQKAPFSYDIGIKLMGSKQRDAQVTICCHGYGSSNDIIRAVNSFDAIGDHLVSFNFPDYNCIAKKYDPRTSSFGTINEILPLLYVIKLCVIDAGLSRLNLYGFSAGGGAVINALAVLNHTKYDAQLKTIGIHQKDKRQIISALEQGLIILDCPLKSLDEIMALRGKTEEFTILAERYTQNGMRPVDAIQHLPGLILTILVHFQQPDEILSNRDDALFIERLRNANRGTTAIVIGNDGGHNSYHACLWRKYKAMISAK